MNTLVVEPEYHPPVQLPFPDQAVSKLKVALYSHDTMGLGHTRRNLLIAQALTKLNASTLLITGASQSAQFQMPEGVDCLTLPSLHKNGEGSYEAKALELSLEQLIELRSKAIKAALKVFKPDVFIVDNVPWGAENELKRALKHLKKKGRCKLILGLRDILDEAEVSKAQWQKRNYDEAIENYFDSVWVYGDEHIFNPVKEYELKPEVARKMRFLGYFDQRARLELSQDPKLHIPKRPFVLCQVGGGQDGFKLAESFVKSHLPKGRHGLLITGPYMPAQELARLKSIAESRSDMSLLTFVNEPTYLLQKAERVIAMGGYNTVGEVLSFEKPFLVVPRVKPRLEQLIRAQKMAEHRLLDFLHPDDLTPEALSQWLNAEVHYPEIHGRFQFSALKQICFELKSLMGEKEISYVAA